MRATFLGRHEHTHGSKVDGTPAENRWAPFRCALDYNSRTSFRTAMMLCHGRPARARAWPGRPWHDFGCGSAALGFAVLVLLLGGVGCSPGGSGQKTPLTVTVGHENADVVGDDNRAIQQAVDRVAAAGGGTVLIKAGTYTLSNAIRLASHVALKGEGKDKTILKKGPALRTRITIDAESTQYQATVENAAGFQSGM